MQRHGSTLKTQTLAAASYPKIVHAGEFLRLRVYLRSQLSRWCQYQPDGTVPFLQLRLVHYMHLCAQTGRHYCDEATTTGAYTNSITANSSKHRNSNNGGDENNNNDNYNGKGDDYKNNKQTNNNNKQQQHYPKTNTGGSHRKTNNDCGHQQEKTGF